ncbi:unnamed protein product [Toxocara canis]|uniref:Cytochrome P450 n=1 Tax=Toxocara canis TaxID=6265 RepID=A0A183V3S1_TOXCA|nr:unnamed protein product [Toxocara canis]
MAVISYTFRGVTATEADMGNWKGFKQTSGEGPDWIRGFNGLCDLAISKSSIIDSCIAAYEAQLAASVLLEHICNRVKARPDGPALIASFILNAIKRASVILRLVIESVGVRECFWHVHFKYTLNKILHDLDKLRFAVARRKRILEPHESFREVEATFCQRNPNTRGQGADETSYLACEEGADLRWWMGTFSPPSVIVEVCLDEENGDGECLGRFLTKPNVVVFREDQREPLAWFPLRKLQNVKGYS